LGGPRLRGVSCGRLGHEFLGREAFLDSLQDDRAFDFVVVGALGAEGARVLEADDRVPRLVDLVVKDGLSGAQLRGCILLDSKGVMKKGRVLDESRIEFNPRTLHL